MVLYNISRPVEPPHNYNLNPFTIITETALPGPPSLAGPFSHAIITLQKKSEKFKKSVDNYRPREYNIRVLATIAQLAEHLIRNERVVGSNPISGSKKSRGCRIKPFRLCATALFFYSISSFYSLFLAKRKKGTRNRPAIQSAKNVCLCYVYGYSSTLFHFF